MALVNATGCYYCKYVVLCLPGATGHVYTCTMYMLKVLYGRKELGILSLSDKNNIRVRQLNAHISDLP